MLLEHVKGIKVDAELEAQYAELVEQMGNILNKVTMILNEVRPAFQMQGGVQQMSPQDIGDPSVVGQNEAPSGGMSTKRTPPPGQVGAGSGEMEEVMAAMDQVMKQMDAAKRGLGLVNKLSDSPSRTKNRSRVMGNMNRIRGNIRRIEKMLAGSQ